MPRGETAGLSADVDNGPLNWQHPTLTTSTIATAFFSGDTASHLRTIAYFAYFLGALSYVLYCFPWRPLLSQRPRLAIAAPLFSLTALVLTWRLILLFFVAFTQHHANHPDPPNLFVEAYALVCTNPAGWWWSSALLCWVTVACPVVHAEAVRRRLPPRVALAYIILAFLGAVSLAFPLLFAHLLVLDPSPPPPSPRAPPSSPRDTKAKKGLAPPPPQQPSLDDDDGSWWWSICVGLALGSIVALPLSVHDHEHRAIFTLALVVVHIVLALPYLFAAVSSLFGGANGSKKPSSTTNNNTTTPSQMIAPLSPDGLRGLACATAVLHAWATAAAIAQLRVASPHDTLASFSPHAFIELIRELIDAARANVCQASISIDAVLSTVAGLTYTLLSAEVSGEALSCLLLSPVIGPAAALALTAVWRAEREPEWMAEDAAVTPLLPIQDEKPLRKSAGSRARAAASPARARVRS